MGRLAVALLVLSLGACGSAGIGRMLYESGANWCRSAANCDVKDADRAFPETRR